MLSQRFYENIIECTSILKNKDKTNIFINTLSMKALRKRLVFVISYIIIYGRGDNKCMFDMLRSFFRHQGFFH